MRSLKLFLVTIAIVLFFTACGQQPASPPPTEEIAQTTKEVATEPTEEPIIEPTAAPTKESAPTTIIEPTLEPTEAPTPEPEETQGGTIIIGKPQEATGTDPQIFANAAEWQIFALVYEQLVTMDENLRPIPQLAEDWSTDDGLVYHFTIRQGVKFHNGREMTADDVVWSLQRLLNPETGSALVVAVGPIQEVRASGPYEVEIVLSKKFSGLVGGLAGAWASILPAKEIQAGEMDPATDLLGTGPFKVVDHLQDQEWDFERNTDYWGEIPRAEKVVMKIIRDDAARVAALRTGEIQLAVFENPNISQLLQGVPDVTSVLQNTTDYYFIFVNTKHPPLDNVNVRRAISVAIDRDELRNIALYGTGQTTGPIPAPMSDYALPVEELPYYTYNPEQAKQLLEEAGVDLPVKLKFYVTSAHQTLSDISLVLRDQLSRVGIDCEIVDEELGVYIQDVWVNSLHDLTVTWYAGYGEPSTVLSWMPRAVEPATGRADERLEELLANAAAADPADSSRLYAEVEKYMAEEAATIYLDTLAITIAYRSDMLDGVQFYPIEGYGNPFRTLNRIAPLNP